MSRGASPTWPLKPGPLPREGPGVGWPLSGSSPSAGQKREDGASLSDNEEPPERVFCFNHQRSKTSPIGLGTPRGPEWPGGSQEELLWAPNPPLLPQGVWLHAPSLPELLPRQSGLRDLQTLHLWGRDLSTGVLLTSWLWPYRKHRRGQEETKEGLCS